jgi:hypothetical protein
MLILGESGSLDRLIAHVGRESIHIRVIPHESGTLIIDLRNDQYYLVINTKSKDANLASVYVVKATGMWSDIIVQMKTETG